MMKKKQKHIDESIFLKAIENTLNEKERSLLNTWLENSVENTEFFEKLKR